MKQRRLPSACILAGLLVLSCGRNAPLSPQDIRLTDSHHSSAPLSHWLSQHRYTVFVFISASCPCVRAHAARFRALSERYAAKDVGFIGIDPEFDATLARAEQQRHENGWNFPVLADPRGALAEFLGAEYANHAAIVDSQGHIHYQGGIDSDRKHLHDDATPYLANALDDALAGRAARVPRTEALGCVLRRD